MRLFLLLLAGAAIAGEPGFDEIFDPSKFAEAQERMAGRQAAFESAAKARGAAAAVPGFRGCERAIEDLRERLDRDYEAFGKLQAQWWGWRRQYEADYQKKHGRPPAEYPIPQGLNSSFLDAEKAFRRSRSMLLQERLFHEWALARTAELLREGGGGKAIARGLGDRAPVQRLRCARLARALGATAEAAAAAKGESHPGVLAALAEVAPSEALLGHAAWNVRAGAIRGAARLGTREAAGWLVARLEAEDGRLRDDLVDALRAMSGEEIGYDAARWRAWGEALSADWRAKGGGPGAEAPLGPLDEPKAPGAFSDGPVSFFGARSATRAAVWCVQASAGWEQIREGVKGSVATLPDGAQFGVVAYDSEARRFKSGLVEANAANRDALARWLDGLKPDGGADPYAGLDAALASPRRRPRCPRPTRSSSPPSRARPRGPSSTTPARSCSRSPPRTPSWASASTPSAPPTAPPPSTSNTSPPSGAARTSTVDLRGRCKLLRGNRLCVAKCATRGAPPADPNAAAGRRNPS
jgi:hypothetical protein